jgi:hypothetical protein
MKLWANVRPGGIYIYIYMIIIISDFFTIITFSSIIVEYDGYIQYIQYI